MLSRVTVNTKVFRNLVIHVYCVGKGMPLKSWGTRRMFIESRQKLVLACAENTCGDLERGMCEYKLFFLAQPLIKLSIRLCITTADLQYWKIHLLRLNFTAQLNGRCPNCVFWYRVLVDNFMSISYQHFTLGDGPSISVEPVTVPLYKTYLEAF